MENIKKYGKNFGIYENLPGLLSMSLGAGETTLMRLTTAYAMIVNGGKKILLLLLIEYRTGEEKQFLK